NSGPGAIRDGVDRMRRGSEAQECPRVERAGTQQLYDESTQRMRILRPVWLFRRPGLEDVDVNDADILAPPQAGTAVVKRHDIGAILNVIVLRSLNASRGVRRNLGRCPEVDESNTPWGAQHESHWLRHPARDDVRDRHAQD